MAGTTVTFLRPMTGVIGWRATVSTGRQGLNFPMSGKQRMTRGIIFRFSPKARVLLQLPLPPCSRPAAWRLRTRALWDKFTAKDDTFVEDPADKTTK